MLGPRSKACAIALAFTVASSSGGGVAHAAALFASGGWVRAVQPRAGSPLEIELGGDASRAREVIVRAKSPLGGAVNLPFPPVPQGSSATSLRLIGGTLDRDFKGYSLEVLVRDLQTGETVAVASTTIG
ncbi:MAG: hypothetical protein JNM84_03760 [Planctomycetes bacterium]|jgi:hypothetical protein|nr:hypothetical protein [Planctomycetota bacterium]